MQKLGFAQLSSHIPATSMVYRPFGGYISLFKSQHIIIFQCILCKWCWSRAMFYYVQATPVVYRPFGGYPSLFKSQYIIIFAMHSVQLWLLHTLWGAMHACLYRLQAFFHRYDMGSWVGGYF